MKRNFIKGDFVHIYNRGNRKAPIVQDEGDKWRFLKLLRFFNDEYSSLNFSRDMAGIRFQRKPEIGYPPQPRSGYPPQYPSQTKNRVSSSSFGWPKDWPKHKPLVKILSYCLKNNHYHLLLKEIKDGGIGKFMQKLSIGFTNFSNIKHGNVGTIFQGPYKDKTIKGDMRNLDYVDCYIQVFNPFEDYPGGLGQAIKEFDKAFEVALENPFCSLGENFGRRNLGIIDRDVLGVNLSPDLNAYKEVAREGIVIRNLRDDLGDLALE